MNEEQGNYITQHIEQNLADAVKDFDNIVDQLVGDHDKSENLKNSLSQQVARLNANNRDVVKRAATLGNADVSGADDGQQ